MSSMRMSFCLKAVKTLGNHDLSVLTDAIEGYVKAGMATKAAERAAVNDMIEQVNGERGEIVGLLRAQHAQVFEAPPAAPSIKAITTRTLTNPDNEGQGQIDPARPEMATAKTAAQWLAQNGKEEWVREVAAKLADVLDADAAMRYLEVGKSYDLPAGVAQRLRGGAFALSYVDPVTGVGQIFFRLKKDGGTVGEQDMLHELIHQATQRALTVSKAAALNAELNAIRKWVGTELRGRRDDAGLSAQQRDDAEFFGRVIDSNDELLAYGLTSPTFREWAQRMTADGRFMGEKEFQQLDRSNKDAERAYPDPADMTLWQRFVDAVRSALGLEKKYAPQLDALLARNDERRREFITANTPPNLLQKLDDMLQQVMAVQASTTKQQFSDEWKPRAGGQSAQAGSGASTIDQTDTPEFKRWFGDSKVVDAQGKPLVVYHGTADNIATFKIGPAKKAGHGKQMPGIYFSPLASTASGYARSAANAKDASTDINGANVVPAYVSIRNPAEFTDPEAFAKANRAKLEAAGHDGAFRRNAQGDVVEIVAFEPEQIKSATGNNGAFDPSNPDIRAGTASILAGIRGFNQTAARNLWLDATSNAGKLGFWGRTIGTQYAKAQKHPTTFGRVFNAVQDYIKDINIFANAAADMAPTILPKLESWLDLKNGGLLRHGADPVDLKAAGSAVFQGTLSWARDAGGKLVEIDKVRADAEKLTPDAKAKLMLRGNRITEQVLKMWQGQPVDRYEKMVNDKFEREFLRPGVVFTEGELRRMGLSGAQIGLYKEFRAAVDQSLTDLAKSEMLRLAGSDGDAVAGQVMAAANLGEAAQILREHFDSIVATDPERKESLDKTADTIADKSTQVDKLKAEGYAPLMRFGRHTLHIVGKDGETMFFGMYESRREANKAAREMQSDPEFNGAEFKRGMMSQEAYKLYAGVPIDALELFAKTTGNENAEVYQDFLRLTKNNRSALKRMIHRQGIAGFSEDTARVLASFVTSNARMASGNLNLGRAKTAAEEIPKEQGDLKDDAVRLVQYVQDPQEEAAGVRGLLFTNFIGGSVASAAVNLTQPITMTLPYLSQFGGAVKAGQHLLAAARTVAAGAPTGEIAEAMKRAEDDGIVSPQEIHHLQAEAMNRLGNHPILKKAAFIWGSLFSLSEQFNRRVTFVAAYNAAKENHIADPFAFAEKAVVETQGLYNKGNSANLARGPIGKTLFTFKQFSIHYLEFLERMWRSGPQGKRAVGVALAVLVLVAGAGGLPFADDLDDAVDTLAQALGYDFSSKAAKRRFVAETLGLGNVAADVATRGLSSLPGFPIDVSLRMGMGNLLPGTGALLRSNTDRSKDVLEFAGAAGSLAKNALDAGGKVLSGDVAQAGLQMAPLAIQNMAKAMQMWNTGEYRNQRDQKVIATGPVDAAMKFIGFQPAEVARESSRMQEVQRSVQLAKNVEGEIAAKWANGLNDNDPEKVKEARQQLAQWNADNPSTQMRITMQQVIQRVREMRMSRQERTIKSTPRELREKVREQMQ